MPVADLEKVAWLSHLPPLSDYLRYGTGSMRLEGEFIWESKRGPFTIHLAMNALSDGREETITLEFVSEPTPPPELLEELRRLVGQGSAMAAEARTWSTEWMASGTEAVTWIDPHGANLKAALFRLANHPSRPEHERFDVQIATMVDQFPTGIGRPRMAVGSQNRIQVMIGDHEVEHLGSGARQWVWLASWAVATDAFLLSIEEPETNFSWKNQLVIARLMKQLARSTGRQVFASSHAPLLVDAVEGQTWFEITRDQAGSALHKKERRGSALGGA